MALKSTQKNMTFKLRYVRPILSEMTGQDLHYIYKGP